MKSFINYLKRWWQLQGMSPEERYLAEATDAADLEHRMRVIADNRRVDNQLFWRHHIDPLSISRYRYY